MKTVRLDAERRPAVPSTLAPGDAVSLEALDADNWLVKRLHPDRKPKVVVVQTFKRLPNDSKWEKVAKKLARAAQRGLPEPG